MILSTIRGIRDRLAKRRVLARSDTAIHPSARVNYRGIAPSPPSRFEIGEGSMFEGSIAADRDGATVVIGRDTFVGGSMLVCADRIEIGDDVLISWGCTIVDHHSHAIEWRDRARDVPEWYAGRKDWANVRVAPIRIGDKAWIGFNAIVMAGVTIGEGAVVGCGSVVTRDVAPYAIVAGNPARVIRTLDDAE